MILLGAAEAVDHVRRMQGKGVTGKLIIAWNELLRFKRSFTGAVPQAREKSFAESGIHTFHGRPKFRGRRSVVVGSEAGKTHVRRLPFHFVPYEDTFEC